MVYFNPTRVWMRPLGFFILDKGDSLCGVVERSEEFESIVPRVRWPRSPEKAGKKVINGKLYSNMIHVTEVP